VVLSLGERAHEEVELRFSETPPSPLSEAGSTPAAEPLPPAQPVPSTAAGSDEPGAGTRRALQVGAWVAVGVGASGLATGVVSYLLADRQYQGFKRRELCANGGCSQEEVDNYNALRDIHRLSLIAGGIVAAAGATVLVLTWKGPTEQHQQVRLEVAAGSVTVSGSF
jgi:hypothetical protein